VLKKERNISKNNAETWVLEKGCPEVLKKERNISTTS